MRIALAVGSAALAIAALAAEARAQQPESLGGGSCSDNVYNCPDTPNPLPAPNTVWIEEMTWMDVRDALDAGTTTAIIPTGGMEPNGPWLVTGKHNYVLRANCDAIARQLGDALCAPIVKLVPEGNIDPPSSHMQSPGTISMREQTFRSILTDVARSLKAHGFDRIIFIGDSGGNQGGQRAVAQTLNAEWGDDVIVAHVQEYYDYGSVSRYMEEQGLVETESDGLHDDAVITLNMFADDPSSVRYAKRVEAGLATINGVSIADRVQSLDYARQIVAFRAREPHRRGDQQHRRGGRHDGPAGRARRTRCGSGSRWRRSGWGCGRWSRSRRWWCGGGPGSPAGFDGRWPV